jgi:hypothetical protein
MRLIALLFCVLTLSACDMGGLQSTIPSSRTHWAGHPQTLVLTKAEWVSSLRAQSFVQTKVPGTCREWLQDGMIVYVCAPQAWIAPLPWQTKLQFRRLGYNECGLEGTVYVLKEAYTCQRTRLVVVKVDLYATIR